MRLILLRESRRAVKLEPISRGIILDFYTVLGGFIFYWWAGGINDD